MRAKKTSALSASPRWRQRVRLGLWVVILLCPALATALDRSDAPEAASGFAPRPAITARQYMAVTAHPLATAAALEMLRAGGSAVDAAISAQWVLGLVEPQSSGPGGGGFLLHFDARRQRLQAWDGRETAPAAVTPEHFLHADGRPMGFHDAAVGGHAVGVPGLVRMLEAAHRQHGRLPWAQLAQPAIRLARDGFAMGSRLSLLLERDPHLRGDPAARTLFYDAEGRAHPPGHRLRHPAYADTLSAIAQQGAAALHRGPIAADLLAAIRLDPRRPGLMTAHDLVFYLPRVRAALCRPWTRWIVCGMPPPSSGGLAMLQVLGMLEAYGLAWSAPLTADDAHVYVEALRLAFADRNRYIADPDRRYTEAASIPAQADMDTRVSALLDPRYLRARAALIGPVSLRQAPAGQPFDRPLALADDPALGPASTTHLSVTDRWGDAVALTSSIEDAFGARLMVRGLLLNNQLTDFSFLPRDAQGPVANRIEPGKRPRSSMSPTLVFERRPDGRRGRLVLITGSPGGSQIITYTLRSLLDVLAAGHSPTQALAAGHLGSRNGPTELEQGRWDDALQTGLLQRGHALSIGDMTSGVHMIRIDADSAGHRLTGAADPRREGMAAGD